MPSANGGESRGQVRPPDLPPDLEQDFRGFTAELIRAASAPGAVEALRRLAHDERALARLSRFGVLLHRQSEHLSLLAQGDRARVFTRHILDSLNPLSFFEPEPGSLIDVGSGAGLPGIPLAVAWPDTRVTLIESREKRAGFLERAVRELELTNVVVVCARLEEAGSSWRAGTFEAVTIRALGGIGGLLHSASRIAAPGARWIYFLGDAARAGAIRSAIERVAREVDVSRGATGGWLLTGRFA